MGVVYFWWVWRVIFFERKFEVKCCRRCIGGAWRLHFAVCLLVFAFCCVSVGVSDDSLERDKGRSNLMLRCCGIIGGEILSLFLGAFECSKECIRVNVMIYMCLYRDVYLCVCVYVCVIAFLWTVSRGCKGQDCIIRQVYVYISQKSPSKLRQAVPRKGLFSSNENFIVILDRIQC